MFETIVRSAGNIVRWTFIPVIHAAAPNELDSKQDENFLDRLKVALVPGYGTFCKCTKFQLKNKPLQ